MAAATTTTTASPAGVPEEFKQLVLDIVRVPNPQFNQGGRTGEQDLMDVISAWFAQRDIQYEADPLWGMHAVIESPAGPGARPAVMLSAHLDSDNLDCADLASLAIDGDLLRFDGMVGLDCKTGVAIALSVAERLRTELTSTPWTLHLLFTIGEESGQKGAIRAPLPRLMGGKVRYGIVIDRQTGGSGAPTGVGGNYVRHAVGSYKGVPLLDPDSRQDMITHLNSGMLKAEAPGAGEPFPLIESPNNADALEWRGRWDAEVVAPALLASGPASSTSKIEAALAKYNNATKAVLDRMAEVPPEDRVSGMYSEPRMGRYKAMKEVYDAVHSASLSQADLHFSCVNLSYDYSDRNSSVDLRELDLTARIVMGFVESAVSV